MSRLLDGTRIVVVGAGVARLATAACATRLGADVVVVEARERLGGRARTDRSLGAPVDLGAAAIHGAVGNPLTDLAHAASVATLTLDYDSIAYYAANGARIGDDAAEVAAAQFESLRRDVQTLAVEGETLAPQTRRADFEAFEATVHDRLLFAGEHTIADRRGTAHGAYLSGKRAAKQIGMLAPAMR